MITHTDETEFNKSHCKLVNRRHDELVQSGVNPDLAAVRHEVLRLDSLRLTPNEIAAYLLGEPLPLAAGRRGATTTSAKADVATSRAARASRLAEDSDDAALHEQAARAHRDAADMHADCAAYHRQQIAYHHGKANPAEARAAGSPGLECALEDHAKTMHCPHCDIDFAIESPDDRTAGTHIPCPNCHARLDIAEGTREGFDENGEPMETARTEPADAPLCCARALPHFLADAVLPASILYMPGGIHRITPSQAGKPVEVVVKVDSSSAARLEKQRQILAASGNPPFFSVQHNTQIAAFWPSRLYWASQVDPTGKIVSGIWADGEWTAAGREAIEGRNFRSFSPTFFVNGISTDEDNPAEIACNESAPLNMGALENDPAFGGAMSPLWPDQPRA